MKYIIAYKDGSADNIDFDKRIIKDGIVYLYRIKGEEEEEVGMIPLENLLCIKKLGS